MSLPHPYEISGQCVGGVVCFQNTYALSCLLSLDSTSIITNYSDIHFERPKCRILSTFEIAVEWAQVLAL